MSQTALTINSLTCTYGKRAVLNRLSLAVAQGEIVCLLGASGCGKTTLLNAVAGLHAPVHGQIRLGTRLVDNANQTPRLFVPPEARHIGMIFQDYALFPHLTVKDNIAFGLRNQTPNQRVERVKTMLELVQLTGFARRYPHELSGGQQQRLAIARAMAPAPGLILLDEPFSNIDAQVRQTLIEQIRTLFKSQGITAVFVTHSRDEAFAFADRLAVMNRGVIEQIGTPQSLYQSPQTRFVANFLGPVNTVPIARDGARLTSALNLSDPQSRLVGRLQQALGRRNHADWLIRPELLLITPIQESEGFHGAGTIENAVFLGGQYRYRIALNGLTLTALSPRRFNAGERVGILVMNHEPLLFDAEP